jgi:HEPN domain-containing protein/predicted nucleotidyltransferase
MKTTLPEKSESHEDIIHEIKDIILYNHQDKIAFIILFGSFARGDWVYDYYHENGHNVEYASDYDFLIITKNDEDGIGKGAINLKNSINKKLKIFCQPYKSHNPSFIIEPIIRINEELEKGQYFFTDIKKEGILLYDSKEFQFAKTKKLDKAEIKKIAQEDFKQWFVNGKEFLIDCNNAFERDSFKKSAFYLHQAAENFLTCTLLVLTGYRPKIHNLRHLIRLCSNNSNKFLDIFPKDSKMLKNKIIPHRTIPEEYINILYNSEDKSDWFELLKIAYIESRYSKFYKIKKEQLEYLIARVEFLREVVKEVCEERIG